MQDWSVDTDFPDPHKTGQHSLQVQRYADFADTEEIGSVIPFRIADA